MDLLKTELVDSDPPVLLVVGEIDLSTVDQLRIALEEALATDRRVVVDMAGVTFVDAAGVQTVLQVAACLNGGGPLQVTNAPRLSWLLEVVGLDDVSSIVIGGKGTRGGR